MSTVCSSFTHFKSCLAAILLFLMAGFGSAQILPADRCIDWSNSGVPGGIPSRTTIDTTLNPGATAAQLNAAITTCPNGQVIKLNEGTYDFTSTIYFDRSNITIRGAGIGKTILIMNTGTSPAFKAAEVGTGYGISGTISSGYLQGSTSITVSNAGGITTGNMMLLYEANDPDMVWSRGGNVDLIRQPVMVTGVNGNTITFAPPLVTAFQAALNPKYATYYPTPISAVGVEDLTIRQVSTGQWATIWFCGYANWFKNIEIFNGGEIALCLTQTVRNEVSGCYIHETNVTNEGYGVDAYTENTGLLVENNIFEKLWTATILDNAMGCVVAYNYSYNMYITPLGYWPHQTPGFIIQHMAHGMMTLWEGNLGQGIQSDGYHGSGSHQTLFRNWFHGLNPNYPTNRKMIDLDRFTYYCNAVGNVLGDASWTPVFYEMTGTPGYTESAMYRLGYPNMGNNGYSLTNPPSNADDGGLDPKVKTTLLRWGNFDYKSNAARWEAGEVPASVPVPANHTLPASLYLSAKPAWWGNLLWPPIGPDLNPIVNKIPAQVRYEGGMSVHDIKTQASSGLSWQAASLYDIRGRKVGTLTSREMQNRAVAEHFRSGVYFAVTGQGTERIVKKMVMMK